jgi:hypothetical protein
MIPLAIGFLSPSYFAKRISECGGTIIPRLEESFATEFGWIFARKLLGNSISWLYNYFLLLLLSQLEVNPTVSLEN